MRIRTVVSISVPLSLSLFTAVLGLARAGEAFAADAPAAKAPLPPPVIERVMPASGAAKAVTPAPEVGRVLRGKYLVDTGGCGDCHTPWKIGKNGPKITMTAIMVLMVTLVATFLNIGLRPDFVFQWIKAVSTNGSP